MAEKGFGVKEINLIGASGTPTIESPNNLNLNAVNVAISTNVSIGGTLTVTGNISAGGTVTYEDVTNVDSIGIITARQGVRVNADSANSSAASATNYLSVGASQDLKLYHHSNQNYIVSPDRSLIIQADNIMHVSDDTGGRSLYQDNANSRLELGYDGYPAAYFYSSSIQFIKPLNVSGIVTATNSLHIRSNDSSPGRIDLYCETNNAHYIRLQAPTHSNFSGNLTVTLPNSSGTLLLNNGDGSNLTGIAVTEAPVVDYTITSNGASAYRFHGGGVDETADDPDLYLIRGQKYRFNNTTGTGHPFRFSTTGNANAAYSNGVTGDEDGVQFWTIPYDAPEKLFYVCTLHPAMVGNIYIEGGPSDIKMCDQWRRAAVLNTNNGENFITTDWERVDGSGQGTYIVNGGMSESGGIFTFPRTGIYLVTWQAYAECTTTSRQNAVNIYITTNNSSYSNRASSVFSIGPDLGSYNYGAGHCSSLVDVTDTSQVKVKFRVFSSGNVAWDQSSAENRNVATFLRIGDT